MYRFHCSVHSLPAGVSDGQVVALPEGDVRSLSVRRDKLAAAMSVSFEQAYDTLSRLPRMFIEPDGSFVWVSSAGEPKWQVDGNLYDRSGLLMFVDLKGFCPAGRFDDVIATFRGATPLMFQLVRHAVFVNEEEFRAYAKKAYLSGSVGEVY
jgi:hypothetical protein